MTTNLPPHLRESILKMADEYENNCFRQAPWQDEPSPYYSFNEGAKAMYCFILQELGPVVEAIENLQCHCHFNCTCGKDEARQALKHLKERVLNVE